MLQSCKPLLKYHYGGAFFRRNVQPKHNLNLGVLSNSERGDAFTEPEVYRSRSSVTAMVRTARKETALRREQRNNEMLTTAVDHEEQPLMEDGNEKRRGNTIGRSRIMHTAGLNDATLRELNESGNRQPATRSEKFAARFVDNMEMGLSSENRRHTTLNSSGTDHSIHVHRSLQKVAERREQMMSRYAQQPTALEYQKLFGNLQNANNEDETIVKHQRRLVEDFGIYPETRMDAYMLDDDSLFPAWVTALPYSVQDRVKYGNMGLTEEDEALRVRLGRMPSGQRQNEWKRLKAAKEYRASQERALTPAEVRAARQGKRRFHWLRRKQQQRASDMRRLALRKPEEQELWPSHVVDYSQRLAFIAQHVENGVETNGQWPLDGESLARAKLARAQQNAHNEFLASETERQLLKPNGNKRMNSNIQQMLDALDGDKQEKTFKRLSRKKYANRVNAVVHGDQDEYGRRYRHMETQSKRRTRPYESVTDIALERELRNEPRVNTRGLNHTPREHWPRHTESWMNGMPSTRYGS